MLREVHDDHVVAAGWPWHGRVTSHGGIHRIDLPGGGHMVVPLFNHSSPDTYLFDMGLPDTPDAAIEAKGGAWWGRAILRGGRWWSGYQFSYGTIQPQTVQLPLWWPGDQPPPQLIYLPDISAGQLRIAWRDGLDIRSVTRSWLRAEIGQDDDKIPVAGKGGANWRLIERAADAAIAWTLLDVSGYRLLYGLTLQALTPSSGQWLPHPPGTSLGSSPGGAPETFCGLVEIVIDKALFGAGGGSQHIEIRVIENRRTALGDPQHSLSDQTDPATGNRIRTEAASERSALLTAWYGRDGRIRSARFNREQSSTFQYTKVSPEEQRWEAARHTAVELVYGGVVRDSRFLAESSLLITNADRLSMTRTVRETGEQDDVATYEGQHIASSSLSLEPLAISRAGQNLVMGVVTYYLRLPGQGDVLRAQDLRHLWLVRHSNNVASLCRSREPYDYPEGSNSFRVEMYSGPAIGPHGPIGGVMTRVLTRHRDQHPYIRSFFSNAAVSWIAGTGNPVTGEIARANDYYQPPGAAQISWV